LKRLGLLVNPIAGMGGRVGLKGTDGPEVLKEALRRGASPWAPARAREALKNLSQLKKGIEMITYPHGMGEEVAWSCGFSPRVMGDISPITNSSDTKRAACEMIKEGVDLLLFAGGDGTARDIYDAVGESMVVLGIPAGVKIHSAAFASTPSCAGELAKMYLEGMVKRVFKAEVMDIDEEDFRKGILSARLYGYLVIPYEERHVQRVKAGSSAHEKYYQEAIAQAIVEQMSHDFFYLIGPGTTTRAIAERLGLPKTLLGVDIISKNYIVGKDLNESELIEKIREKKAKLIITPIGGQGYLFGRGNQQLSPRVIEMVGRENIIIVATREKIHSLQGRPLLLDTGDEKMDASLRGYWRIITGYRESIVYECV
jgi:predicted polyphosphate/ATP-dependent NAD kinase